MLEVRRKRREKNVLDSTSSYTRSKPLAENGQRQAVDVQKGSEGEKEMAGVQNGQSTLKMGGRC
jgi:hypothetical protein